MSFRSKRKKKTLFNKSKEFTVSRPGTKEMLRKNSSGRKIMMKVGTWNSIKK